MADPFEQCKESDAAIEQARQAVEAQEAAEAAAAEAARIAAQEEAARQQYNQYGQPQQQYGEAQYGQPQQQYSEAQYGQMQPQTQAQQQYNQYGQVQQPQQAQQHSEAQYGQPQQQQPQQFTQGASFMSEEELPPEYRPVGMWGYVGYEILFSLPVVGLVLMFIFSFSGTDNVNLKNFARAKLIMIAIGVALFVVLIVAAGAYDLFEELFG